MTDTQKYQDRIARRILKRLGGNTLLFCLSILVTSGLEAYYVAGQGSISETTALRLLLLLIGVICVGTATSLVSLYITACNAAQESIRPLADALEREKMFTSYASHELRTPLAIIKGSLEVLIRRPRTEEEYRRKITENIKTVDQMNTMVDNLLMLTRVESGKMRLTLATCCVKELLEEVCATQTDPIVQRQLNVSLDVSPAGLAVCTDHTALVTLLTNVMANAVKYCNEGGSVTMRAAAGNNGVVIEVENTGAGMTKEEAARVFAPFYRAPSTGSRQVKGFGLGLAIVSRMADLLGAEVCIDSAPEGPTTVRVKLPIK